MAKAQPTVEPEVIVDTPEVVTQVAVEVLMEGVKSGSTYTLPNGTVVTNH